MSLSLWSYLKGVFWGRQSESIDKATEAGLSAGAESGLGHVKNQSLETTTIDPTEPLVNALTALPFYDENLLDSCITQWKFGDWQSLIKITDPHHCMKITQEPLLLPFVQVESS